MKAHRLRPGVFERVLGALLGATLLAAPALAAKEKRLAEARAEIERLIAASGAEVAVAARTLDGKEELLIAPEVSFHAASTMKIAVMIELFRQARAHKASLEELLPVKNEFHSIVDGSPYALDAAEDSDPEVYRAIGQTMTLGRLCEAMITRSSNLTANLLIERLGVRNIQCTVHKLHADGLLVLRGVEDSKAYAKGLNNTTTARALMKILEAIARGRAVDPAASRAMAEILQRQQFNEAIPAGLPPGTPVAHKTGEITRIHHDAAIVYAPRPYVLVVLVRGLADAKQSAALIAEITRAVHRAIQAPGNP